MPNTYVRAAAEGMPDVNRRRLNPAGEVIEFTDLESVICDADNMMDVLLDMCETHFCKSGEDNIVAQLAKACSIIGLRTCQKPPARPNSWPQAGHS
ncbi:hypothetical protein [Mesorhizobium sp.]|uniref:hypothetical protein n=1 Tax=Mesorhizobium sp. TaxID=1871066 RepID=UPI000FE780A7|nr:hypothetical protein [Mesorhizobium sp.]RWI20338.1 MAG: hypothetical protein EOQ92_20665 [Mesorhizobium sp.]RWK47678.1 MAG: hypothetical protein EOR47_20710 [Mesorhizobium sp.]RWK95538.1 MAG: hypothetical protein EOR53_12805 [Mesorhizobium sp.]TIP55244.1 MAG: hypothetical protein E5X56_29630 [Mesorhizobium sp.]TIP83959.1 MAG: hypothetical protein E5X60_31935 [Mesorhizobium sp.]